MSKGVPGSTRKKPAHLEAEAVRLYVDNRSSLEVAALLGVSKRWVMVRLMRAGVTREKKPAAALGFSKAREKPRQARTALGGTVAEESTWTGIGCRWSKGIPTRIGLVMSWSTGLRWSSILDAIS